MVCAKAGNPRPAMGLPLGATPCPAAHTLTGNPSTLPHLQGSGGAAGTACAGSGGGTSVGACGVRSTGSVEGGPCAAVLSMRGVGSHAGSSWWGGLQLDVVQLEEEDCFIINIRGARIKCRHGCGRVGGSVGEVRGLGSVGCMGLAWGKVARIRNDSCAAVCYASCRALL